MFPTPRVGLVLVVAAATPAQEWVARSMRYEPPTFEVLAFDAHRGRVVDVRGDYQDLFVHEWDGVRWTFVEPATALRPPTTELYAATYDGLRHRVLCLARASLQQIALWSWNGAAWQDLGATLPRPFDATIAYDAARDRVVCVTSENVPKTWEYDGGAWQLSAQSGIPDLYAAELVYDPVRQRSVLYGGYLNSGPASDATYEWDGQWHATAPVHRPDPAGHLVYDSAIGRVVRPSAGPTMWTWDGVDWQAVAIPSLPSHLGHQPLFTYDGARQEQLAIDSRLATTYVLSPSSWLVRDQGARFATELHAAANDVLGVTMLLQLQPVSPLQPDTATWDGFAWTQRGNLGMPIRTGLAMADRDLAGANFAFGGRNAALVSTDTLWRWDGGAWTDVTVPGATPRYGAALAVDPVRHRLVLFGGYDTWWLNDTKEYDGTQWLPRYPSAAPSPRTEAITCFDEQLGVVVLYGGISINTRVGDCWAYDGTTWTQWPTPPLPLLPGVGMAFDRTRQQVVLTGWSSGVVPATVLAVAFDGTGWVALPNGPNSPALAIDPVHQSVITVPSVQLLTAQPAQATSYGAGCAAGVPVPVLRAFGEPHPGNASFACELSVDAPVPPIGVLGFGPVTSVTLPGGCLLLVDQPTLLAAALVDGFGTFRLPLPPSLGLRGLAIGLQGGVLDAASPLGLAFSNGVHVGCGD